MSVPASSVYLSLPVQHIYTLCEFLKGRFATDNLWIVSHWQGGFCILLAIYWKSFTIRVIYFVNHVLQIRTYLFYRFRHRWLVHNFHPVPKKESMSILEFCQSYSLVRKWCGADWNCNTTHGDGLAATEWMRTWHVRPSWWITWCKQAALFIRVWKPTNLSLQQHEGLQRFIIFQ